MRFTPEEKLDIIQLASYSGLGFKKTLNLFGIKPHRVWRWIRKIEDKGFAGLIDQPPIPRSIPSKHLKKEKDLVIKKAGEYVHLNHRKLAHQIFRDENVFVSESLTYHILKEQGLIRSKPILKIEAADKWKHQPQSANEIWHIDISYIPCGLNEKGKTVFYYLIAVLGGYSRFVLAWDLFPDMKKERCFQVVDQAIFLANLQGDKRPRLLSDNGKQFRARKAGELFKNLLNIKQIFASPHHPETNGKIERLFKTTKYNALYHQDYSTHQEAREILLNFFDYYNNRRLHQSLEYRTPREVYYGLNQNYSQRRQKAKIERLNQRKEYWKSGDSLTISKSQKVN